MLVVTALFLLAVTGTISDPTGTTGTTSATTGATGTGVRGPAGSEPEGSSAQGQAGNFIEVDTGEEPPPAPEGRFILGVGPYAPAPSAVKVRDTYRGPPSGTVLELSTGTTKVDPLRPRLSPR